MKEDRYTPVSISELLDSLSENWGVPYESEAQLTEYITSLNYRIKNLEAEIGEFFFVEERYMNTDRIEAIHKATAYPQSVSVQQALLKVWNESAQDYEKHIEELERRVSLLEPVVNAAVSWYLSASFNSVEPLAKAMGDYFNQHQK